MTTLVVFSVYMVLVFLFAWPFLGKWSKVLFVVGTVLIAATMVVYYVLPHVPWRTSTLTGIFDVRGEYNFVVLLTITIELIVCTVAFCIALFVDNARRWHKPYWGFVGFAFLYVAVDEYHMLHDFAGDGGVIILGVTLVALSMLAWLFVYNKTLTMPLVLLVAGLGVSASGAFGLEVVFYGAICNPEPVFFCDELPVIEEMLEMFGMLLSGAAVVTLAEAFIAKKQRAVVATMLSTCTLMFALVYWPWPPNHPVVTTTRPIDIAFENVSIKLEGYRIEGDEAQGLFSNEKPICLNLYYAIPLNSDVDQDFGFSVHLLSRPERVSEASIDFMDNPPPSMQSKGGHWVKICLLPEDSLPMGLYDLALTVFWKDGPWYEDGEITLEPIFSSDHEILGEHTLILDQITVVGEPSVVPEEAQQAYSFSNGIILSGYYVGVPEGGTLPLEFWWETSQEQTIDYIQLLHLYQGDNYLIFDDVPFSGRFPTSDWPTNYIIEDSWLIDLPEGMAAGEWQVYTGLYDPVTVERVSVTDEDGNPQPNQLIEIGTITIS